MGIRENLQKLIDDRKISSYALGPATGVSQPTITRILQGKSADPKSGTVAKLARYFGVSPEDLRGSKSVASKAPNFSALSQDAIELLQAWERLPSDRQHAIKDQIFFEVFALEQMPWLKRGRPTKETYDQFEQRMKNLAKGQQVRR